MPPEWIDQKTGSKLIRLTPIEGDNRSFYFHNNPFIPEIKNEGDIMVFYGSKEKRLSDRWYKGRESKQLYTINLKTREIKQITNHPSHIFGEIVAKKRREATWR